MITLFELMRSLLLAFPLAVVVPATPARACERDSPNIRLPGDTSALVDERAVQYAQDRILLERYEREKSDFANAKTVYLAEVVSKETHPSTMGNMSAKSARVRPIRMIKGSDRPSTLVLTDTGFGGLCDDVGDGYGALTAPGKIVIVFEGLAQTSWRPNGIDSLRAEDIRTDELVAVLVQLYGVSD